MTTQVLDPWQTAMDPPKPVSDFYGQIKVNAWFCALVKGQGKVAWDPNTVDPNTGNPARRFTAIDLALTPITDQVFEDITRTVMAEFGEWPEIVLPSLKTLGIANLQTLNNTWVHVEMTPTGRTYVNSNGETKEATTFKFLAVYADEAACRAARGSNGGAPATQPPAAQAAPAGNGDARRATALKFLKPYVENACRQSGQDVDKARELLVPMLAGQKLLAEFFTVDSPEVIDLMTATMAP